MSVIYLVVDFLLARLPPTPPPTAPAMMTSSTNRTVQNQRGLSPQILRCDFGDCGRSWS